MHMAMQKKSRGRLSRDDQRRLGDILRRVYDDVLKQGVPERFERLLHQLDESARDGRQNESGRDDTQKGVGTPASERVEHAMSAKALDQPQDREKPQDKGSRE
jgi:hypothetical protein